MATNKGVLEWEVERDDEGHRTYTVDWLLKTELTDGPSTILQSTAIPLPGSIWNPSIDSVDVYAYATPYIKLKRHDGKPGERGRWWVASQKYTTKPVRSDRQRCNDTKIEDPLLEPMKVSGGFQNYTEEATRDRFGAPILNSAYEQQRGQLVEFEANRPTVRIEQNVPLLGIEVFAPLIDCLNDSTLWGLPARCWKLSNVSWERVFYGSCNVYYKRTLELAARYETWDRIISDEGCKALNGDWSAGGGGWRVLPVSTLNYSATWLQPSTNIQILGTGDVSRIGIGMTVSGAGIGAGSRVVSTDGIEVVTLDTPTTADGSATAVTFVQEADPSNPTHFVRLKDRNGENTRVVLNGAGVPWDPGGTTTGTGDDEAGRILIQKYNEANLLVLGLPLTL